MGKANRIAVQSQEVPELKEQIKKLEAQNLALNSELLTKTKELEETKKSKDSAYSERNNLVCALSKLFPSYKTKHPEDPNWEATWRTIIVIDSPMGQLSWHIHDSEESKFIHLAWGENKWDGHTTEEKYKRLEKLEVKKQ